ncbi:MAG: hypothetical protein V3U32_00710 [Anaerolineales bacterium]
MTSRLSKLYRTNAIAETLFLVFLGVVGVSVHAYLRWPLKVPGHNGLVWIALLMIGRLVSQRRWAATISSASAAAISLLPVMGFKDPLNTITFLIPGIVIDLGFLVSPRLVVSLWALALLGAFAHVTKPVAKLFVSLGSGFPYPSLIAGVFYPLSLHALFGAAGAILAAISVRLVRPRS